MTIKNFIKKVIKKIKPEVKNIYIGCGNNIMANYTGCDTIKTKNAKIVCATWELSAKVKNLNNIYFDKCESLTPEELQKSLKDWYKALAENGLVKILSDDLTNYNDKLLRTSLEEAGFVHITCEFIDNTHLNVTARKPVPHNFELNSGERQIGKTLSDIREDHINRYLLAVNIIKQHCNDNSLNGLDIFCGNGYGEIILTQNLNAQITAYDGSKEAVDFAEQYYKNNNTRYIYKKFPFELKKNTFDFIISLESIEHIKEYKLFVKELSNALKENGILIISSPNEKKNNLIKNNNPFHYRHFASDEFIRLFQNLNMEFVELYGQDCYEINPEGYIINTLESEKMKIIKDYEGQFNIYIFKKQFNF